MVSTYLKLFISMTSQPQGDWADDYTEASNDICILVLYITLVCTF